MRLGRDSALPFQGGKRRERWERLVRRERLARERLEMLSEAGKVLTSSIDYEVTLRHVIELALPLLGDFGFFDVYEGPNEVHRLALARDDLRRQQLLDGTCLRTRWLSPLPEGPLPLQGLASSGEPVLHANLTAVAAERLGVTAVDRALLKELQISSLIVVPLRYHARWLGSLTLFFGEESDRCHGEDDLSAGTELAQRAAAAVENARLFRQAQEAARKRDDFLSVASHELKTPLTTLELQVTGLLRALRLGRLAPEEGDQVVERLDRVERQVKRLNLIIEDLLDASRVAGERLQLHLTEVDLREVVEQGVKGTRAAAERAGSELQFDLAEVRIQADRSRFEQVVGHLVSNALKYGNGKPVELSLTATPEGARLQVSDHGIGIAAEDQERIFERFERAVSPRKYSGLGMGLWMVKRIVEAHGGRVSVISVPGVGSSFSVELPR